MAFYPSGGFFTTLVGGTIPGNLTINPGNFTVTTGNLTVSAGNLVAGTLTTTPSLTTISPGGINIAGFCDVTAVGFGFAAKEGTNAKQGTATLTAGTVVVANTSVTANSRIFLTGQVLGGTAGGLNVTSRVAGTSFTVTSTNAADTSTFAYEIFEPG